jgi:hypothetical protein
MSEKEPGRMAYEAASIGSDPEKYRMWIELHSGGKKLWARVEAAIRADERERAAKVAEAHINELAFSRERRVANDAALEIAAAIRAGEKP